MDWDCSDALEALLAEDAVDGDSAPTELQAGSGLNSPPLYSPFSDGSTQSLDSGFATPLVSEEDQLLAGLFGVDCPLLGESTSTTVSVSPTPPISPRPLASPYSENKNHHATVLVPLKQSRQHTMFEFDDQFETSSLSPPPSSQVCVNVGTGKKAVDKSRKNAEAARQNRLKKKKYMEDIEKDRSRLRAENVILKTKCAEFQAKYKKLETEVAYLRSVLANQSTLASLIKNIPGTPGVNLSSSFSRKWASDATCTSNAISSANLSTKRPRMDSGSGNVRQSGGVCLHVSKDNVSLEFCSQCSLRAAEV